MADPLFFIALLPNLEVREEVTEFKNQAARLFETRKALNSPPHITLQPPFRWKMDNLGTLQQTLVDFSKSQKIFFVQLNGFGCFRPKVIFVKVEPTDDLTRLHGKLVKHLSKTLGLESASKNHFRPHMTVAFRDLQPEKFDRACAYFSRLPYQRFFEAERLTLLQHNGKYWEIRDGNLFGFK